MAWVGRDLRTHPVPSPCCGQDFHPPAQDAQAHIQFGLEHLPGIRHPQPLWAAFFSTSLSSEWKKCSLISKVIFSLLV